MINELALLLGVVTFVTVGIIFAGIAIDRKVTQYSECTVYSRSGYELKHYKPKKVYFYEDGVELALNDSTRVKAIAASVICK